MPCGFPVPAVCEMGKRSQAGSLTAGQAWGQESGRLVHSYLKHSRSCSWGRAGWTPQGEPPTNGHRGAPETRGGPGAPEEPKCHLLRNGGKVSWMGRWTILFPAAPLGQPDSPPGPPRPPGVSSHGPTSEAPGSWITAGAASGKSLASLSAVLRQGCPLALKTMPTGAPGPECLEFLPFTGAPYKSCHNRGT